MVASDLREENALLKGTGPYVSLDVMNKEMLHVQVIRQGITQIYLLAAILSATGEKNPNPLAKEITLAISMYAQEASATAAKHDAETVKAKLGAIKGKCGECHTKIRDKK